MSKKSNKIRSEFLREYFFKDCKEYKILIFGKYVLQHRWDGNTKKWSVATFTRNSFERMNPGRATKQKSLIDYDVPKKVETNLAQIEFMEQEAEELFGKEIAEQNKHIREI